MSKFCVDPSAVSGAHIYLENRDDLHHLRKVLRVDFRAVVAATGVSSVLVVMLLAASMLLSMISPIVFEIFVILACGAWIVGFFTTVFQVFGIKMNIINTVVVVLGIAVATYAVVELITWLAFNANNFTLFTLLT